MFEIILFFIIILVVINATKKKDGSEKTNINEKKTNTGIKVAVGIIILLIGSFMAITNHRGPLIETYFNEEADGFTIERYDVSLNVSKDNKVDVVETIDVNFYESGHHGIYKFIPTWLKYTGKDGDTISRESKISNLKAEGYEYEVETVSNDKKRIKIGSAGILLNPGLYTYKIKYTYDMGDDPFLNFDEFIFHAYGDFWGTEIKNPTIEVTLPESFDGNVKFFNDKYRHLDITNQIDYERVGNTIYAKVKDTYSLTKSLTIDIELPEGYFINESNNKMFISIALTTILILILLVVTTTLFRRWQQYGKDPDKEIETVEFYPPEKLDPAQLGYIFKKETGRKLTIALIVSLASKGYIKIEEEGEKKKKIVIINNKEESDLSYRRIKAVKNKDVKLDFASKAILSMLDKEFFKGEDEITIESAMSPVISGDSDVNRFLEMATPLIDKGYIKVTLDDTEKKEEKTEEAEEKKMSHAERIVYDYLFQNNSSRVVLEENKTFYKAFGEVNNFISSDIDNRVNNVESYKEMSKSAWLYMLSSLLTSSAMYTSTIYNNITYILFVFALTLVLNITGLVLTLITRSKTKYATRMQAQISGFKNYLLLAEKEQLEDQVNKNPHYFYDILPYAYVLGVSKKWISKFEKLNIPFPHDEGLDLLNDRAFDSISSSVYYPPSSSGSSGCGGGCSSCGGGCSSCGGGGSW